MGSVDRSPLADWFVVPLFALEGDGALFFELPSDHTVQGKLYASRSTVNKFSCLPLFAIALTFAARSPVIGECSAMKNSP